MASNDVQDMLKGLATKWQRCPPPAEPAAIERWMAEASCVLPEAYLQLLAFSNEAEGPLSIAPYWFQIWPAEQVVDCNQDYAVNENVQFFWGGSNGGGELLVFEVREPSRQKVYMIPFVLMALEKAVLIAENFETFINAMRSET